MANPSFQQALQDTEFYSYSLGYLLTYLVTFSLVFIIGFYGLKLFGLQKSQRSMVALGITAVLILLSAFKRLMAPEWFTTYQGLLILSNAIMIAGFTLIFKTFFYDDRSGNSFS